MDSELKRCKRTIRLFLRTAYTGERLAWLLVHARNGKLAYQSCCCLVGLTTADHALRGKVGSSEIGQASHYWIAKMFLGAREAEWAFYRLGFIRRPWPSTGDELRRRRLVPIVLAEIQRRARKKDRPVLAWSSGIENGERRSVKATIS